MDGEAETSFADELLDDLLPESLDWRRMVTSYPMVALAISAVGGYFIGRRHGTDVLDAVSRFATDEVDRNVSSFLGRNETEDSD